MPDTKEKVNVFTYWEGPKVPYIELCYETMKKYCPQVIRLNEETVKEYVNLPKEYFKIEAVNHRTDYLKARLLYEQGGWWLDADTIVLKELPEITHGYMGCAGLFGAQKGSEKMKEWYGWCEKKIHEKSKFYWHELIEPILEEKIHGGTREITNMELSQIAPFFGETILYAYFCDEPNKMQEYLKRAENSFAIILYNKMFPQSFKEMSKREILDKKMVISELFRRALGDTILPQKLEEGLTSLIVDRINQIIDYLETWEKKYQ